MKVSHLLLIVLVSIFSSAGTLYFFNKYSTGNEPVEVTNSQIPVQFSSNPNKVVTPPAIVAVDFTQAAELTTPAVVHVKTTVLPVNSPSNSHNPFHHFFGDDWFWGQGNQPQPQQAAGSGVIVSEDGYIITNNHVVEDAGEIEVVLNNKNSFKAQVVGTDPSTDLALLKIDETGLPFLHFSNSDQVKVGQWVLAVGNPFNLASTVTAGIVSAKGRNINILRDNYAIESFIQTDAAVNPGNSGGALVNTNGELIGINTAIATPTGTFAGYSFAIPTNLVQKVVMDLKEHGIVQRGFLGVSIRNVNHEIAEENNMNSPYGVYVAEVMEGSASDEAGLKSGDIITHVNGKNVDSSPELQEQVAQYRPGDQITIKFIRDGNMRSANIILKNKNKTTQMLTKESTILMDRLGIELEVLEASEASELGITGGLRVKSIQSGKIRQYTDMQEGFIITSVDRQEVAHIDDFIDILEKKKGGVMVEGMYPEYHGTYYYAFGL